VSDVGTTIFFFLYQNLFNIDKLLVPVGTTVKNKSEKCGLNIRCTVVNAVEETTIKRKQIPAAARNVR
jgi:hypothetical protein